MNADPDIRRQLVEAGLTALSAGEALATLDDSALIAAGAPPKYDFASFFLDREEYLCAVLTALLDQLWQKAIVAAYRLPPGIGRMKAGVEAFLNSSLRHAAVLQLALVQGRNPRGECATRNRNCATLVMLRIELREVGAPNAVEVAPLIYEKVHGIARSELEMRVALPALRDGLFTLLEELQS